MRTVCFIQARLQSQRLPGKILMDLAGEPMIRHVVRRAERIKGVDAVYILAAWGASRAIQQVIKHPLTLCWNLPQNDVFARFFKAARQTMPDYVVRVTADCPLLESEVGGRVVAEAHTKQTYATNDTTVSGYPDGYDVQCFPVSWLMDMGREQLSDHDREHVCTWMDRKPSKSVVYAPEGWQAPYPGKLSVDTQDDFDRVRRILEHA